MDQSLSDITNLTQWIIWGGAVFRYLFKGGAMKEKLKSLMKDKFLLGLIILGLALSFLSVYLNYNVHRPFEETERKLKILGDKGLSEEPKIIALLSLIESPIKLNGLFRAAYTHEEDYGPGILTPLFYEYGLGDYPPITEPIGYVDFHACKAVSENKKKYYVITGWAIDSKSNNFTYGLWFDEKEYKLT
jgi:hypothetical protein